MSTHISTKRFTIAAAAFGIAVAAIGLLLGLAAWSPTTAQAAEAPSAPALFGVDPNTAVVLGPKVPLAEKFVEPTSTPVYAASLAVPVVKGVAPLSAPASESVALKTHRAFDQRAGKKRRHWRHARASWYGPGLYGSGLAGGGRLRRGSMIVAHRSLPFGTRILFRYKGHTVMAVVRDRGPFISGRKFDLGPGTARALHFDGVGTVKYRIVRRGGKHRR